MRSLSHDKKRVDKLPICICIYVLIFVVLATSFYKNDIWRLVQRVLRGFATLSFNAIIKQAGYDKLMLIRPATPSDVPAVLPMVAKICALHESWDAAKYGFLPDPQQRYERWLIAQATSDKSVFLVASTEDSSSGQDAQLAAFLIATVEREIPIYRLKEFAFIHDLWVEPEYRHAGIARQMVMLAIERFQLMGVRQIRLDTAAVNEAARRLFSSCGFRLSTMEMLVELNE